jgi:hypothetical protein
LPTGITIVREYRSQQDYTEDAGRLARLGYVVMSVVEPPLQLGWMQWVRRALFPSARVRLVVSYSDHGAAV